MTRVTKSVVKAMSKASFCLYISSSSISKFRLTFLRGLSQTRMARGWVRSMRFSALFLRSSRDCEPSSLKQRADSASVLTMLHKAWSLAHKFCDGLEHLHKHWVISQRTTDIDHFLSAYVASSQ